MASVTHIPVLLKESLSYLSPLQGGVYADCTIGMGGHSSAILPLIIPGGKLIGIDLDEDALKIAAEKLSNYPENIILCQGNYAALPEILAQEGINKLNGIIADLGVSNLQFSSPERGFSFANDGPLDMRMNRSQSLSAEEIINTWPENELADLFFIYGEERQSRRIAGGIVEYRRKKRINRTGVLADIILKNMHCKKGTWRIHPATQTFQALRIAVNGELDSLRGLLEISEKVLLPGGRIVVISFHSLEDRIVKYFLRAKKDIYRTLTPKPIVPSREESENNPKARSAKLRAAEIV